jgi:hypothetical protein
MLNRRLRCLHPLGYDAAAKGRLIMQDLGNKLGTVANEGPKLDQSKLFGFRNLVAVSKPGDDIRESSELAFNKRGDENPPPR